MQKTLKNTQTLGKALLKNTLSGRWEQKQIQIGSQRFPEMRTTSAKEERGGNGGQRADQRGGDGKTTKGVPVKRDETVEMKREGRPKAGEAKDEEDEEEECLSGPAYGGSPRRLLRATEHTHSSGRISPSYLRKSMTSCWRAYLRAPIRLGRTGPDANMRGATL